MKYNTKIAETVMLFIAIIIFGIASNYLLITPYLYVKEVLFFSTTSFYLFFMYLMKIWDN